MGKWINKALISHAELKRWNNCLELMAQGNFEPEIVEMISDAEEENRHWDMMIKAQSDDAQLSMSLA
jgi:hypothetical protein